MPPISLLALQADLRRAAAFFDAGQYGACRALLENLARLDDAPLQGRVRIAHALGVVAQREGDLAAARRHYDAALAFSPNDSETHVDRAMLLIAEGEHRPGFEEYEWRLLREGCIRLRHVRAPLRRWAGGPLPASEALLLHAEQGFGDTLLFLRHLPAVRARIGPGVPLCLAVPPPLRRLVSEAFLKQRPDLRPCRVVSFREPLPFDWGLRWQCPLLSLPHALGLGPNQEALFSAADSYLVPPSPLRWRTARGRPRIGLVWRAGAETEGGRYRSLPLDALLPLADLPAEWIGLQQEATGDELALLHHAFHGRDASPACRDFLETADLLAALDLLVTNDTAAAHLAGAIGLPAYVLLPRAASWRWPEGFENGQSVERTPWHPSLRLFRQREHGDWAAPVAAVKAALAERFAGRWPTPEAVAAAPRVPTPPEDRELALIAAQTRHERGDYPGVRTELEPCLARHPGHAPLLRALGMATAHTGEPARALRLFRRALKLEPTNPDLHFSLAFLRLSQGNFRKGFAEYEWRFDRQNCLEALCIEAPLWDGLPLDASQPLLVHCEQGLGDAIQFIRLLPWAKARAATLHLVCSASLLRLFRASPLLDGVAGYVTDGGTLPKHAFQCPLLSLARLSGLRLETVAALPPVPYLRAPDDDAPPLPPQSGSRLRVGLVWKSRLFDTTGRGKSLPLAALLPLAGVPGIEWVSLQKERSEEEAALLASRFGIAPGQGRDLGPTFADFAATAQAIGALDLVIACDTAAAHLAGALGKPVWVPLQKAPDWRWLAPGVYPGGDDRSPWYPTMRLFRQREHGDWSLPVRAMTEALSSYPSSKGTP